MSKLLELLFDFFKALSEKRFPVARRLIGYTIEKKAFAFSWGANYSRRYGKQAIVFVGTIASVYAILLFAQRSFSPDMPKASHDVVLKSRFSSPLASKQILIVDIDERTLALLSDKHGRWPWSREVLADGLQQISDLGPRAILFNIMLSDPDKNNPDADTAMEITAQIIRPVAFPLIRLAQQNDNDSKLKATQIPGTKILSPGGEGATLAAILPMFTSMHDRLGVANQKPDSDGIVRKYAYQWQEAEYVLPTIVGRTLQVSDQSIDSLPLTVSLNWRNKRGRYSRISFGDLIVGNLNAIEKKRFENAFVIMSVSAPGIGQIKATGVSALEDDGEILATALDDAINKTYLRLMPNWAMLVINLFIIWVLVWITTQNSVSDNANKLFVILQASMGSITLVSASYTNYLIDMSDSMSFGIGLFGVIKLLQNLDDRWSRAKPGFRKIGQKHGAEQLLALGWLDDKLPQVDAIRLHREIESIVGMSQVVRVDDLFAGESFLKPICSKCTCLLVHINPADSSSINTILSELAFADVMQVTHDLKSAWDTENRQFAAEVAPHILELGSELLQQEWLRSNEI